MADGHETDAEAVGTLPLLLSSGFILKLNNVLFVPVMRRNLISVSMLDDDGIHCNLGNNECLLKFDDEIVGRAPRHDKLYLLPLNDSFVMNVPLPTFHENFVSMPGTITPLADNLTPHPAEDSSVHPQQKVHRVITHLKM